MLELVIHRFAGLKISKNGHRVQAETVLGASYWKCHLGKESERRKVIIFYNCLPMPLDPLRVAEGCYLGNCLLSIIFAHIQL